jgi:hypothetical protein
MNDPEVIKLVSQSRAFKLPTRIALGYRRIGLLPCASTLALVLALVIHHTSRLPSKYTWLEPLRTLRDVVALRGFLVALLLTYFVGRWEFRGNLDVERLARSLRSQVDFRTLRPKLVGAGIGAILLLLCDYTLITDERSLSDCCALVLLGAIAGASRPSLERLKQLVGHSLVGIFAFSAICYAYTVVKALAFTHHSGIDAQLIALESAIFGAPPHRALAEWAGTHPQFLQVCDWVYFRFFHHMALVTILLVGLRQAKERTEYLGALAFCYLIGGPLYHLLPGVGPGYFEASYFPYLDDPSLMVGPIRLWLQYNTVQIQSGHPALLQTWGYIACMPSLHVAQEFVMLYYARRSPIALLLSTMFTAITLIAVVVLGWHYPIDSLGGLLVALVAILIARATRDHLMPATLMTVSDDVIPPRKAVLLPLLNALRRSSE